MNITKVGAALLLIALTQAKPADAQVLKVNLDSVSYAFGKDVGASLAGTGVALNADAFLVGLKDALGGAEGLISKEEGRRIISAAMRKATEEKVAELKKEETAFFAALKETAKDKPNLHLLEEGLYYEVLRQGDGAKPTLDDEVVAHYKGSLANGKVFDSSYDRAEPLTLGLNRVIKGWQLGIPQMNVGSKYRLYIASDLGYGERGAGADIPPYSALVFEIELIDIKIKDAIE